MNKIEINIDGIMKPVLTFKRKSSTHKNIT